MKQIRTYALLAATVALSACSWMPEWMGGGTSSGEGYVDTQPPYAAERTASGGQTPAPAIAPAAAPSAPVVEAPAEPTPAPMNSAEPMVTPAVTK